MFKVKHTGSLIGLFVVAFAFALMLTMTMVSTSMACSPGICHQNYEVCPFGCDGDICTATWTNGGDDPVCCGDVISYICGVWWTPDP